MHLRNRQAFIKIFNKKINLPNTKIKRRFWGILFFIGGLLWILPVFGVWMFPVSFIILSYDSPRIRRWRRKLDVVFFRWFHSTRFSKTPEKAKKRLKKNSPVINVT